MQGCRNSAGIILFRGHFNNILHIKVLLLYIKQGLFVWGNMENAFTENL